MKRVKILFDLDSNDWHSHASESLWGELQPSDDVDRTCFRILNSPFFVVGISFNDVVACNCDAETLDYCRFSRVSRRGGHSTYMLLMTPNKSLFELYWVGLGKAGCTYESGNIDTSEGLMSVYSIDVPPTSELQKVVSLLELGVANNIWIVQEGYIARAKSSETLDDKAH